MFRQIELVSLLTVKFQTETFTFKDFLRFLKYRFQYQNTVCLQLCNQKQSRVDRKYLTKKVDNFKIAIY